jgi:hypothetical protein
MARFNFFADFFNHQYTHMMPRTSFTVIRLRLIPNQKPYTVYLNDKHALCNIMYFVYANFPTYFTYTTFLSSTRHPPSQTARVRALYRNNQRPYLDIFKAPGSPCHELTCA